MNRVLNVILISGLASILACAPGSRHQQAAPPANNVGAKPKPTPGPTPSGTPAPSVVLAPTVVTDPNMPLNKNFDPSTGVLLSADVLPPKSTDKAGSLILAFTEQDSKNQKQSGSITLDGSTTVKNTDPNFSNMTYSCDTPNVNPDACPNLEVKFTWNGLAGDAKVALAKNLPVIKAIDGKADSTIFGGAVVNKLDLTLGTSPAFSRTNAEIVKTTLNDSGTPDDKQLNSSNVSIIVFGLLPAVDLDGNALHAAETLSGSSGRMSSVSMSATTAKEHELIYTLGMLTDTNDAKLLTLTISIPLNSNVAVVDDGSDATQAATAGTDDKPAKPVADVAASAGGGAGSTGKGDPGAAPAGDGTAVAGSDAPAGKPAPEKKTAQTKPGQQSSQSSQQDVGNLPLANNLVGGSLLVPPAPTAPAPADVVQKDFCKFRSSVEDGEWVEQNVDIVNGKVSLKLDAWMSVPGRNWQLNYCDSTSGRLAVRYDAPGAVSCLSKIHSANDEYTETVIFGVTDLSKPGSCFGRMTHYTPGSTSLGNDGSCYVRPLDNKSLHVMTLANNGEAAISPASNTKDPSQTYAMSPVASNPGQFQISSKSGKVWEIFSKPLASTTELQCWGRTTKYFSPLAN